MIEVMALDGENENLEYDFMSSMPDPSTFVYFHSEPSFQSDGTKQMPYASFVSYQDAYPTRTLDNSLSYSPHEHHPFASFGTYDPFQGSPLEISNFSFLDSREPPQAEEPPPVQQVPVVEPVVEVPPPKEQIEEVQKRSYKDVLTIPPSPTLPIRSVGIQKNDEDPATEIGKPKISNTKQEVLSTTPKHLAKTNLNNHRIQININPKKPLKINNNLSSSSNISKKGNNKVEEKNLPTSNESVRSVPSQTDFASIKRKPAPVVKDLSFELPPSDEEEDDDKKFCVTSRIKDRKKTDKSKVKIKESHHDRSSNKKTAKRNNSSNQGPLYSKTYVQKVKTLQKHSY